VDLSTVVRVYRARRGQGYTSQWLAVVIKTTVRAMVFDPGISHAALRRDRRQRGLLFSPRCALRLSWPWRNLAQLSKICWLTSPNLVSSRADAAASSTAPPGPAADTMTLIFSLVSDISLSRVVFNSDSSACMPVYTTAASVLSHLAVSLRLDSFLCTNVYIG